MDLMTLCSLLFLAYLGGAITYWLATSNHLRLLKEYKKYKRVLALLDANNASRENRV